MKNWDYANHSHDVKLHGGVDGYNKFIQSQGAEKWIAFLAVCSPLIIRGSIAFAHDIQDIISKHKESQKTKRLEAKETEENRLPQKEKSQR